MLKNRTVGLVLIIIGILANNYVYLHDLVVGRPQDQILLGFYSAIGIVVALLVVALGLVILMRSTESEATT